MHYFIDVILPISLPQLFTYAVSEADYALLQPGIRVAVPFGKTKFYTAIVYQLHQQPPLLYQAKEIHQVLDHTPIVNNIQLQLWQWIANYYMCTIGDVYKCALPSGLLLESETIITAQKQIDTLDDTLSDDEYLILSALNQQSSLKISEVIAILNKKKVLPLIQNLIQKNIISLNEEMIQEYKPKLVRYIKLHTAYEAPNELESLLVVLKNATKQKQVVLSYFQLQAIHKKPITVKQLIETATSSSAIIKTLIDKKIFEEYYIEQERVSFAPVLQKTIQLSTAQTTAYNQITEGFTTKDVVLLHGITASGKTEVYIKLIESYLEQNKQILYLLPEIALTTQLVGRLVKHFGDKIAVFHSKYSNNERIEVWNKVQNNATKASIVIGARSALFLPFKKLGLIVIDEEHEQTFKQTDPAPRYHARDTAIVLANLHKAKVILGSATPSLETYYNTQNGKYTLVTLNERFGKSVLPTIVLVDLKESYFKKKMTAHFSQTLLDSIAQALSNGEQIILLQNRRGYSPIIECLTCGHVPQCPQCDVSLTYHKFKAQLRCHYCGYSMAKPTSCHACSSIDLTTKGFGTEQIEIELSKLFPTKNIKRMDQDTTRGKYAFDKLLDSFKNQEIDILIGTQMLAKGLDFNNVSVVGILNADSMLYFPDFRAFERSYQLMVQVAGRAGRAEKKGTVIIQTYNPLHNTVQQVSNHDYIGMYKEQIYERYLYKYPPYYKLIKITLKHIDFEKVKQGSMWLCQVLQQQLLDLPILGPEEPAINRIKNQYIRTILIKIPQQKNLNTTKKTIQKVINSFESVPQYRAIKIAINVDFY